MYWAIILQMLTLCALEWNRTLLLLFSSIIIISTLVGYFLYLIGMFHNEQPHVHNHSRYGQPQLNWMLDDLCKSVIWTNKQIYRYNIWHIRIQIICPLLYAFHKNDNGHRWSVGTVDNEYNNWKLTSTTVALKESNNTYFRLSHKRLETLMIPWLWLCLWHASILFAIIISPNSYCYSYRYNY